MAKLTSSQLDSYFLGCISAACHSEWRPQGPDNRWWYIVIDDQIMFKINTPFQRVTQKATDRVRNQLYKKFGLHLADEYFLDDVLQPLFTCNCFRVGKHRYYLCKKTTPEDAVIKRKKLLAVKYGISEDQVDQGGQSHSFQSNMSWTDYRELYYKAYGVYPEIELTLKSTNVEELS